MYQEEPKYLRRILETQGLDCDLKQYDEMTLDGLLRKFYASVRTKTSGHKYESSIRFYSHREFGENKVCRTLCLQQEKQKVQKLLQRAANYHYMQMFQEISQLILLLKRQNE